MKKMIAATLCAILALGIAGCGSRGQQAGAGSDTASSDAGTAESSVTTSSTDTSGADSSASGTESTTGSKTLVVYYSATGNTREVAEMIAKDTNADTFEIVPEEVYTNDDLNWSDDNSRVSREHEDESLQDVPLKDTTVDNWTDYDTVFIGYPIWWGIAAWPVNNFIKSNDFTGKTVIPFCTSASSGLGQSGKLLEKMAGTGDWQKGMRFASGASESDIASWVKDLGY